MNGWIQEKENKERPSPFLPSFLPTLALRLKHKVKHLKNPNLKEGRNLLSFLFIHVIALSHLQPTTIHRKTNTRDPPPPLPESDIVIVITYSFSLL
jgi:hypothetical protein